MGVANIIERGLAPNLTNQELASMALEEDQAARAAAKRGNMAAARQHRTEADRLAALLK